MEVFVQKVFINMYLDLYIWHIKFFSSTKNWGNFDFLKVLLNYVWLNYYAKRQKGRMHTWCIYETKLWILFIMFHKNNHLGSYHLTPWKWLVLHMFYYILWIICLPSKCYNTLQCEWRILTVRVIFLLTLE